MFNRKQKIGVATAALLAIGSLIGGTPASAEDGSHANTHVQTLGIPLTGSVAITNAGTGCATAETVAIQSGSVAHVKVVNNRNNKFIIVDLIDVTGLDTAATPQTYLGEGNKKLSDQTFPSDGTMSLPVLDFHLDHTTDGCADSTLPVTVKLVFVNGQLQSSSTAVAGP